MKKRTICLITSWYPTKENPYHGLFFKEQAMAVSDAFDFLVVHYYEHARGRFGKVSVAKVNQENNTTEYDVHVKVPLHVTLADVLYDFRMQHGSGQRVEGIGKYVSPKRAGFTRKCLEKIFSEHFQDAFDVLYCVDAQTEAYWLQCISEAFQKPYVVGEHAPVPWPGTLITDVNKFAIEKADLFLAISHDKIRQLLLQNIRLPETRYIGNLVDEILFPLKEKVNSRKPKTFVTVAANVFYKNYDMLIQVMERLAEITDEPFRILIIGYGANKGYSKDAETLKTRIRNSILADRTEMIPEVPHRELSTVLARADAFVMTSVAEGQPVSAMEAACCGLPVFATRCGGVEDYVDGSMGRICAVNDVEGMARNLKAYLEGEAAFDSRRIREAVTEKFGTRAFTESFMAAFRRVLEKTGANA